MQRGCTCDHSSPGAIISEDISDTGEENNWRSIKRHQKRRATLKDPASTGRKEAARLYPLLRLDGSAADKQTPDSERAICEWAYKERVGGGTYPIEGCGFDRPVGKQTNRHHGPDKSTINNSKGNVHRICSSCHNLWHAKNDESRLDRKKVKSD